MALNVENFSGSTLLGSGWTLHSCHIARHGLNIHHRKIHHWSRSQLQSPVSLAFSLPKWRRHFFWVFFFLFCSANSHILNNHPESWVLRCHWLAWKTYWVRGAGVRILPTEEDTQTSAAPSEVAPSYVKLLSAVQQLDAAFCRCIPRGGPH